jgi:hypothetical protein
MFLPKRQLTFTELRGFVFQKKKILRSDRRKNLKSKMLQAHFQSKVGHFKDMILFADFRCCCSTM